MCFSAILDDYKRNLKHFVLIKNQARIQEYVFINLRGIHLERRYILYQSAPRNVQEDDV